MSLQISNVTPVESIEIGDNGAVLPNFIGDLFVTTTLTSASGTTPVTLITGNPGYFVTRLFAEIDPTCTQTTGGILVINFIDSVFGNIGQCRMYIPSSVSAPLVPTVDPSFTSAQGFFWRATGSTSTLQVSLGTALTAGSIRIEVNGGHTPIVA